MEYILFESKIIKIIWLEYIENTSTFSRYLRIVINFICGYYLLTVSVPHLNGISASDPHSLGIAENLSTSATNLHISADMQGSNHNILEAIINFLLLYCNYKEQFFWRWYCIQLVTPLMFLQRKKAVPFANYFLRCLTAWW